MNESHLTAYALGELPAPDREALERELAASTELQQELKEIVALAEILPAALASDDALTDEQRRNLRARFADNRASLHREKSSRRRVLAGLVALAACVAVAAILLSRPRASKPPVLVAAKSAATATAPKELAKTQPSPAPPAANASLTAVQPPPRRDAEIAEALRQGGKFMSRRSYDLAAARFEDALALDPSNVIARQGLSIAGNYAQHGAPNFDKNDSGLRLDRELEPGEQLLATAASVTSAPQAGLKTETSALTLSGSIKSEAKIVTIGGAPGASVADFSNENATFLAGAGENRGASPFSDGAGVGTGMGGGSGKGQLTVNGGSIASGNYDSKEADSYAAPRDRFRANAQKMDDDGKSADLVRYRTNVPILGDVPIVSRLFRGDESYAMARGNPFRDARSQPLSTFSIDVDTASYANVRRMLNDGRLPPPEAVRVEELVNYFPYAYPPPEDDAPFSVNTEVSRAPWDSDMLLARVALKGRDIAADKLPPSNLVFLVDVSGSMASDNKLPLLQRSLGALVEKLSPQDRVAIVTYAGESGVALKSTSGEDKARIQRAIRNLDAGGSTNGSAGIKLAYDIAKKNFLEEGNNRVILCTDGDFNVGVTSLDALKRLIEGERKSNVFLSVLGFGTGNLKDATMEMLADKGNGNYAYIDSLTEGRKVLVEQMKANLFTIAKDVKIQIEFNPATVAGYRLIGYENRILAKEDFNDDKKDAGEIGAGHTVTALYEIVPAGQSLPGGVDALKYQQPPAKAESKMAAESEPSPDLFTIKLRSKAPDGERSQLVEKVVGPQSVEFGDATEDFRFASAVAAFGMKLRNAENDPTLDWSEIEDIAGGSIGEDPNGYRAEFLALVKKAKRIGGARD